MMIRKEKESVIVVLDGIKVTEKTGVAPLRWALRVVVGPEDEILVLTILNSKASVSSSNAGYFCIGDQHSYIKFLRNEINQRKEAYMQIFRPFYDRCKSSGVKFQVKIAAGFQPKDIIKEEAHTAKATWIVMDRCFDRDLSVRNISLVSDDEEAVVHTCMPLDDGSETSVVKELKPNPKPPELMTKELLSQDVPDIRYSLPIIEDEFQRFPPSLLPSTNKESENPTKVEPSEKSENLIEVDQSTKRNAVHDNIYSRKFTDANLVLRLPLQLSWEVIVDITGGFATPGRCIGPNKSFKIHTGVLADHHSHALVKIFTGDSNGSTVEAEKKAALFMHHKNILGLVGYHKSENNTALVFPHAEKGTLDKYLSGSRGKQVALTFQEKMKIAIGIAQGVRYMHEECPRGPVVHGELRISNIFLRYDLQPLISGFGRVTWLQRELASPISDNRYWHKDPSDHESMALIKSDIFSFGVLLLRLFCRRSVPQDDKKLIEWARPLLLQRAFHELLDEDADDLDMYEIYRVMSAVTQCTKTKLVSRPCMSEVISILKGESSCAMQSSPSSEGSM